jgi:hypothetical protein
MPGCRMPDEAGALVRLDQRLALRPKEAAAVLGVSERKFRSLLPLIPHVRLDGTILIPTRLLEQWLEDRARHEASQGSDIADEMLVTLRRSSKSS